MVIWLRRCIVTLRQDHFTTLTVYFSGQILVWKGYGGKVVRAPSPDGKPSDIEMADGDMKEEHKCMKSIIKDQSCQRRSAMAASSGRWSVGVAGQT